MHPSEWDRIGMITAGTHARMSGLCKCMVDGGSFMKSFFNEKKGIWKIWVLLINCKLLHSKTHKIFNCMLLRSGGGRYIYNCVGLSDSLHLKVVCCLPILAHVLETL